MAGIGFELRRLQERGGLLAPIASVGHGAVIAAGPWLGTVLSMVAIQAGMPDAASRADTYAFRGLVVYAFMISLVATAPIVYVATRQVADAVYLGRFEQVAPHFAAALLASSAACVAAGLVILRGLLGMDGADLLVGVAATGLTGLLWPTLAFCGAVRNFEAITTGFALGLTAAVVGTIAAAHAGWTAPARVAAYGAGIVVTVLWLVGAVLATFPQPVTGIARPLRDLVTDAKRFRVLAAGGLLAAAALWADKWTIWVAWPGASLPNGLRYAPEYDAAMFLAYLFIVPALALFIVAVETTLLTRLRGVLATIREHGTLEEIESRAGALERDVYAALARIMTVQTCVCALAVMLAPAFVEVVGLRFSQVGILRLGIIAALFQFLFIACATLLLFVERHRAFLALQGLFLAFQVGLTAMFLPFGSDYLGLGHLVACAVSAFAAVAVLDRTLSRLTFLVFDAAARPRARPSYALNGDGR